jgi:hypothetical protein
MTKVSLSKDGVATITDIPPHVQYGETFYIMGQIGEFNPLPFDEIEKPNTVHITSFGNISPEIAKLALDGIRPKSLVDRLEAYTPKEGLMQYTLLDSAGIDDSKIRRMAMSLEHHTGKGMTWSYWKSSIVSILGKSWPECAELIYGSMF